MSTEQQVFESYVCGFLLGSNCRGATFLFSRQPPVLPGGSFCSDIWQRRQCAGFCISRCYGKGGSGVVCIGRLQQRKCDKTPLTGDPVLCDLWGLCWSVWI